MPNNTPKEEELTYLELYEIPIEIVTSGYSCEYAGCGSHEMELKLKINLEEAQKLLESLKEIKGIKLT